MRNGISALNVHLYASIDSIVLLTTLIKINVPADKLGNGFPKFEFKDT